jgi:aspartyl aminopeptidase
MKHERLRVSGRHECCVLTRGVWANGFLIHSLHPSYADLHEENHRPAMHKGLVIKSNANQRYATSGITGFLMEEIARQNNIPVQKFVVRNDSLCGSTIGPILATSCGIRTVDVGVPQLSMHSLREMCGVADLQSAFNLLVAFYQQFTALDKKLIVKGEN